MRHEPGSYPAVSAAGILISNNQIVASIPQTMTSANGTQVRFTLGNQFVAMVGAGTYQVGVMTNVCPGGCSSNRVNFTLTAPTSNAPTLTSITPSSGTENTTVIATPPTPAVWLVTYSAP